MQRELYPHMHTHLSSFIRAEDQVLLKGALLLEGQASSNQEQPEDTVTSATWSQETHHIHFVS